MSTDTMISAHTTNELDLKAVWEFRPLPNDYYGPWLRYADGKWIEDDGEYDIAFISSSGIPICRYVELPFRVNIIGAWLTTHWTGNQPQHPRGNPWHYALREGTSDWEDAQINQYYATVNGRSGREGMKKLCSIRGCANGLSVEPIKISDPVVNAGLLRKRDDKRIYVRPSGLVCMYCGASAPTMSDSANAVLAKIGASHE